MAGITFANKSRVTAEYIARKTNQRGWTAIADPAGATAEDVADALNNGGYTDFADTSIVTPENIAARLTTTTTAVRHWRSW